jgi:Tol biopolymer transport system component
MLTEDRSKGTLHLAPAISPDGSEVAYFSEADFFFVDLYLADANTGKIKRRLLKSTFSSNYETFRFLNSQASWSPDGKYLAFAGKRGGSDDLIILDVKRNRIVKKIALKSLNGVTTPSWSPDGKQLVFTGYDGGISDLFVVNADGTGLRRLTEDKYADLHPSWSPDGQTIAFTTDRGPATNFTTLKFGNYRIALLDLPSGRIRVVEQMDIGKNINPVWAPDGKSLAFVSDRNGVSNIYLYDLGDRQVYRLTDFFTGVAGFTPLSPVMSWASQADRLAFMYYEKGKFDVYGLQNPRSLKRRPYTAPAVSDTARTYAITPTPTAAPARADSSPRPAPLASGATSGASDGKRGADSARTGATDSARAGAKDSTRAADPQGTEGGSIYRTPRGFRSASELHMPGDTTRTPEPVSITQLLDSANFSLPDTSEFQVKRYSIKFTPDYIARPSIGYTHDNFGRGFFGGSAVELSDVLGNHRLLFAGYVNGRLIEAQLLAAYANLAHRLNWAVGVSQDPYYFLEPSQIIAGTGPSQNTFVTNYRRLVLRSVFGQASYPFSRFDRVELGLRGTILKDDILSILEPYDPFTGFATADPEIRTTGRPSVKYAQPSLALVHDNTVFGYTGPFAGSRFRFEAAPVFGDWRFGQFTADYRRYDKVAGPVTFATRLLYFGRRGRDATQFRLFGGSTDLIRGNTSGSYRRNECLNANDLNTQTGCAALDRLVGTQIGVASAELRFPILTPQYKWVPRGFPPIEGAFFYDAGIVWENGNKLKWSHDPGDDPVNVRTPLQTVGASLRINFFGIVLGRLDYARPINRQGVKSLWTLSFGPPF